MRNMHNLVEYCVPLIGGSISRPFHGLASPNLVGKYHITSAKGCGFLFIAQAGNDIIKADRMHTKRIAFPTKMKIGMHLGELK